MAETGSHKKSLSYYNRALKIIPNEPLALFNLGTTLYDLDRYDEAVQVFDKVIKLEPKNVDEIRIEINDSSSTHNNNFAITLKSKKVDVDKLLPMAKEWVVEHKQKTWLEK